MSAAQAGALPPLVRDGRTTYIYALHDASDLSGRAYVGMTVTPRVRMTAHLRDAKDRIESFKAKWLRSVLDRGGRPEMALLEEVPAGANYQDAERFWIAQFRHLGIPLVNQTDGGHGIRGYVAPPEVREKLSRANKGRKMPREAVERGAAKRRGRKMDPAAVERMAAFHRGTKRTEEQRKVLRQVRAKQLLRPGNKTGFIGVRLKAGRWDSRHGFAYLGRFDSAEEAAKVRDTYVRQLWGGEATFNFPLPGEKSVRGEVLNGMA